MECGSLLPPWLRRSLLRNPGSKKRLPFGLGRPRPGSKLPGGKAAASCGTPYRTRKSQSSAVAGPSRISRMNLRNKRNKQGKAPGQAGGMVRVKVPFREGVANRIDPQVMSVFPGGTAASVDRGGHGLGIEPRKVLHPAVPSAPSSPPERGSDAALQILGDTILN